MTRLLGIAQTRTCLYVSLSADHPGPLHPPSQPRPGPARAKCCPLVRYPIAHTNTSHPSQNPNKTLRPLFTTFAERYATRPGGYTRLNRAGFRVGDRAAVAVLSLVDSSKDLKFEHAAAAVGRELAVRARADDGPGPQGWWAFRRRVEEAAADTQVETLARAPELEEMTRKNVVKALQFRQGGPRFVSEEGEAPEADEDLPLPVGATSEFLDRAHHHYLQSLATFSLATPAVADPGRVVQQLTSRLRPSEARGAPAPVLTVPRAGRAPQAGQRLDGWELADGVEVEKFGGPIGRAKGIRGRQARRQVYTGSRQSEEALAE